jgi:hypothetical protein
VSKWNWNSKELPDYPGQTIDQVNCSTDRMDELVEMKKRLAYLRSRPSSMSDCELQEEISYLLKEIERHKVDMNMQDPLW